MRLPRGAASSTSPLMVTNGGTARPGVPTLEVIEDFQCPACKQTEQILGPRIHQLDEAPT